MAIVTPVPRIGKTTGKPASKPLRKPRKAVKAKLALPPLPSMSGMINR